MAFIGVFEYDKNGNPQILKVMGKGTVKEWDNHFNVAKNAIAYQEKMTESEEFNTIHTTLLLEQLIKQKVINRRSVNLSPLIREQVQKEVARNAWHWSRKKKLINELEIQYAKSMGTFRRSLFRRVTAEGVQYVTNFIAKYIPQPIKNIWKAANEIIKKYEHL